MGPEQTEQVPEIRIGTDGRMPPTWNGVYTPFRLYHEELLNWKDFTGLKPEKLAPAVIIQLSGEPQRLALTVPREERIKPDGLNKIIAKFAKVYSPTEEQDLYFNYKDLRAYRRSSTQTISDFIGGFTSRSDKLQADKDVKIPPKLLAMMMIDHADLSHEQETNLFGATGGDLDIVKVSRALKLVMKENGKETSAQSVAQAYLTDRTKGPSNKKEPRKKFCRYCKKRSHSIEECWLKQKADQKKTSSFPVFSDFRSLLVNPIVDSAAATSLIGEETLKCYANCMSLDDLERQVPILDVHCFGRYGKEVKTLYSVLIPLPITDHNVLVRADVLPGAHPFLLGGDTQERMGA